LNRHRELARVFKVLVQDHVVGDLLPYFLIRAVEDRQHVGPADDPDALENVQVGTADGDRVDPHDHVAVIGDLRVWHLLPGLLAGTVVNEGSHGCLHWLVKFQYQPGRERCLGAGPKVHSARVEGHGPGA
jgi:hypothetical protein